MPSKKCRLVDLPHREFSVHREGTGAWAIGGIEKLIEHLHKAAAGRVCDPTARSKTGMAQAISEIAALS
jgi:hypothetical protein